MLSQNINRLIEWLQVKPSEFSPVPQRDCLTLAEKAAVFNGAQMLSDLFERSSGVCTASDGFPSRTELEAEIFLDMEDQEQLRWLFDGDYYGGLQSESTAQHAIAALSFLRDNPTAENLPELYA